MSIFLGSKNSLRVLYSSRRDSLALYSQNATIKRSELGDSPCYDAPSGLKIN